MYLPLKGQSYFAILECLPNQILSPFLPKVHQKSSSERRSNDITARAGNDVISRRSPHRILSQLHPAAVSVNKSLISVRPISVMASRLDST